MAIRLIDNFEHPPGTGEFHKLLEREWVDLCPVVPFLIRVRNPHFRPDPPSREAADVAQRRRQGAMALRSELARRHFSTARSLQARFREASAFIRESRDRLYSDLYGTVPGPERLREKAYLRRLARDGALVQAFLFFYKPLFVAVDLASTWDVLVTLYTTTFDGLGQVTQAERAGEPGAVDFPSLAQGRSGPHSVAPTAQGTPGFAWASYYGAFSTFAEIMCFRPSPCLPMAEFTRTFVDCAVREEVDQFLDLAIRLRLLQAISASRVDDEAADEAFLKKLFVAEASNLHEVVCRLGRDERLGFVRLGLFGNGPGKDLRLVRYADKAARKIARISEAWNRRGGLGRWSIKQNPGLGRLQSFIRDATQAASIANARFKTGRPAGKRMSLSGRLFAVSYKKRLDLLAKSLATRKDVSVRVGPAEAARKAFFDYLNHYRWGRVLLDAYIHGGFREGGPIFLRALRVIRRERLRCLEEKFAEQRRGLVEETAPNSERFRRWRKSLSREQRWVLRLRLQGMTNRDIADNLRHRLPKTTEKRASRVWVLLSRQLSRLIPRWASLERRLRAERRRPPTK